MNFEMKSGFIAIVAAAFCCLSCVEKNYELGGGLIPTNKTYKIHVSDSIFINGVRMDMADSLSGYSQTRFAVGAINDDTYGTTTRSGILTLVPLLNKGDSVLFGTDPVFKSFHFSVVSDSCSVLSLSQEHILQNIYVYSLLEPLKRNDCNQEVSHSAKTVTVGTPVYNGSDSLSFNFTKEFGEQFFKMTAADLKDIDSYTKKFPGIILKTGPQTRKGGRINLFNHQLVYDSDYNSLDGSFAKLNFSAVFDGVRKDSCMFFYYCPTGIYDADSLLSNSGTGSFPQYAISLTGHQTRSMVGPADKKVLVEGGGGLKPVISALNLKHLAEEEIVKAGGNPKTVILNKASLVFPFDEPGDYEELDYFWPDYLSPCSRVINNGRASFVGLADSSSETADQGDINRSLFKYSPDITYHLQEILRIDENDLSSTSTKKLLNGEYDIWLLIMSNEYVTTTNSTSDEMSEYYNYLAYQSYYNSMYGGYSSGYGDSYSNYYTYMMMAAYASQSSTSTTASVELDKDRFYRASLNGPGINDKDKKPRLELTFAIPNE